MKQKRNNIVHTVSFIPSIKGIGLMLFLLFSVTVSAQNDELIQRAKQAYDKGKYEDAANSYEKVIASGVSSSKLYYNAANAYYKDNELGKAIYYYEIAHKLDPQDEDVKHNLTIANKLTRDQIDQKENYFAKNIEAGILNFLSTTGWAWLSIAALTIACICFALFRISSGQRMKRILFWIGMLAVVKCIAAIVIGSMALSNTESSTNAIVISDEVNVVNSPTSDAKTQFLLHEGTKVHVLETNAQWTSISLDNGNEGWVATKDIGLF